MAPLPLYELLGQLKKKRSLTPDEERLMSLLDVAQAKTLVVDLSRLSLDGTYVDGEKNSERPHPSQQQTSPQPSPSSQHPIAARSPSFARSPTLTPRPEPLAPAQARPHTVAGSTRRPASPTKAGRAASPMKFAGGGGGYPGGGNGSGVVLDASPPPKPYSERVTNKETWGNGPPTPANSDTVPKWKIESERMRAKHRALRNYDKQYNDAIKTGAPLPPPIEMEEDPTYVQCPTCGRKFSETAGARHIPQCANIQAKPTRLKKGEGRAGGAVLK